MIFDYSRLVASAARALGFLTRLPVPDRYFDGVEDKLAGAAGSFPLAGAIAALPAAALLFIAPLLSVPPLLASVIAVGVSIAVCGALHEDGLADTADGFFGGRDVETRLSIMKDSRNGTYGTLALILSVAVRCAALAAIAGESGLAAALALVAASAGSRLALVWHWFELVPARGGGVADMAGRPGRREMETALATGVPLSLGLAVLAAGLDGVVLMALLTALFSVLLVRLCRDKIGGHTGDTLGASAQVAEISALVALASAI